MDDVIAEQIDYYRARAPEYDRWWQESWIKRGPEVAALWERDVATVRAAVDAFAPRGKVLELACGTGWWTQTLAQYASEIVAVDASAETIAFARERVPDATYVVADLFAWEPDETYDVVFFSFWLSHVPPDRFGWFWDLVASALKPGGRAFFIDNLKRTSAVVPEMEAFLHRDTSPDGIITRKLYDGTEFRAVKVYYEPSELADRLRSIGWVAEAHDTELFFYYGSAHRG